ncbi:hypothetical protein [Stenotrophomonas sp. YIM B06876]|uniref:hypothetical protein n=1 Tax=Stenotrophomonas sp. YIM B06876 TaxID=3060211 RepID=UPI0027396896|nr:hypothetical protein [Stenotrophomonas sp. YIM B06876]
MPDAPRPPSNASRYLFVLIAGLLIGAVATVMLVRAIHARQDPLPGSLMHVMNAQAQMLRKSRDQNRCGATEVVPRLQAMRLLSNDLDLAFPGLRDDSRFQQHASRFRATLNDALAAPPQDCVALATLNEAIGTDCKACHQDFR